MAEILTTLFFGFTLLGLLSSLAALLRHAFKDHLP